MERRQFLLGTAALAVATAVNPLKALAFPTVYPHGTTIYDPAKCWNGYTVFGTEVPSEGTVLIDMNGNVVKQWKNMCQAEHPPKLLEGGYLAGAMRPAPDKKGRLWDDPD
ncbi:MAG: transcriptional initiation protein Tat, partial [Desulfoplanes sp.]